MHNSLLTKKTPFAFWLSLCFCSTIHALTFAIPSDDKDVIGIIRYVNAKSNDSLYNIAHDFNLGTLELIEANPELDLESGKNLNAGTNILLPAAFILPSGPKEGIVLNLAELRIYFFHPNSNLITTYPVGIGRIGWKTPLGASKIIRKRKDPIWRPPASIRNSYALKGKTLPVAIGPGPKNPLGAFALNLDWSRFLIHGTNRPKSVGLRSSSGCIRMYPEDIKSLFNLTSINTPVRIVHEPIKLGVINKTIYLEAHEPLTEPYYNNKNKRQFLQEIINQCYQDSVFNWDIINTELEETSGYPIPIGTNR